jgi:hypothetical protein
LPLVITLASRGDARHCLLDHLLDHVLHPALQGERRSVGGRGESSSSRCATCSTFMSCHRHEVSQLYAYPWSGGAAGRSPCPRVASLRGNAERWSAHAHGSAATAGAPASSDGFTVCAATSGSSAAPTTMRSGWSAGWVGVCWQATSDRSAGRRSLVGYRWRGERPERGIDRASATAPQQTLGAAFCTLAADAHDTRLGAFRSTKLYSRESRNHK